MDEQVKLIELNGTAPIIRRNFSVNEDVAKHWDKLFKGSNHSDIYLSAALQYFLDDYEAGKIKISLGM